MSGAIAKAMSEIIADIPRELLALTFQANEYNVINPSLSITDAIRRTVLVPRVLVDINLVGGIEAVVPVHNLSREYPENGVVVFDVPPSLVQFRMIMSCLSVSYNNIAGMTSNTSGGSYPIGMVTPTSDGARAAMGLLNGVSSLPIAGTASIDMVGPYTVRVRDQNRWQMISHLRLYLSNDENLENLPPRVWPTFAELVLLATKAYIYRHLRVRIGKTFMVGGQELTVLSDIVSEYADANQMYKTYLKEVWSKVAKMIDGPTHERIIRGQMNIGM